ncbi:hypothetical protein Aduo_016395 [Ancylostoma duodenale]
MVWAGICASGKTSLVFIEKVAKITAELHQNETLKKVVAPWTLCQFDGDAWTSEQDRAPSHGAKTTLALCRRLFPYPWGKVVCSSNSSDLNPMDFSMWSILEAKLSSSRSDSAGGLKRALKQAWDEITEQQVAGIVDNFLKRLKECEEAFRIFNVIRYF